MTYTLASLPDLPALVVGRVQHQRFRPLRHGFTHRHYQWLVDLDDLPRWRRPLRWWSCVRAEDHLDGGRRGGGIRGDATRFLSRAGIEVNPDDRMIMLTHARVLGHAFDPLSVIWCLDSTQSVRAVVLEVHNTYRQRHAYVLQPDEAGDSEVDKAFYVSPFNDTRGHYAVKLRLDDRRLAVAVNLYRDGEHVLAASTTGDVLAATRSRLTRLAVTHAFMTQRVSALIRIHGIWLWLRRLPVQTRPWHNPEAVR